MSNAMIKAIKAFQKQFKNKGVEIRTVYALEWYESIVDNKFVGMFNIEFNVLALNKYYSVNVNVEGNDVVVDSDIKEC